MTLEQTSTSNGPKAGSLLRWLVNRVRRIVKTPKQDADEAYARLLSHYEQGCVLIEQLEYQLRLRDMMLDGLATYYGVDIQIYKEPSGALAVEVIEVPKEQQDEVIH